MANFPSNLTPEQQVILKYLGGGLLLGGGTTAAALFAKRLSDLSRDVKYDAVDSPAAYKKINPDTIRSPHLKTASRDRPLVGTAPMAAAAYLALLTGLAGGSYGVSQGFAKLEKNRLRKELRNRGDAFYDLLEQEAALRRGANTQRRVKYANRDGSQDFGLLAKAIGIPLASLALIGLGSGVASYKILDNKFPTKKFDSLSELRPKRVINGGRTTRYLTADEASEREARTAKEMQLKQASLKAPAFNEAVEGLVRLMLRKQGSSMVKDLVQHLANNGVADFKNEVLNDGWESALSNIKSASKDYSREPISLQETMVIGLCGSDSVLRPGVERFVAAEMLDTAPHMVKSAVFIPDEDQDALLDAFCAFNAMNRRDEVAAWAKVKSASLEGINVRTVTPMFVSESLETLLHNPDAVKTLFSKIDGVETLVS
jgi:hypothetical protein